MCRPRQLLSGRQAPALHRQSGRHLFICLVAHVPPRRLVSGRRAPALQQELVVSKVSTCECYGPDLHACPAPMIQRRLAATQVHTCSPACIPLTLPSSISLTSDSAPNDSHGMHACRQISSHSQETKAKSALTHPPRAARSSGRPGARSPHQLRTLSAPQSPFLRLSL